MNGEVQQLVSEIAQTTGAALPAVMDGDAPVLQQVGESPFYFVGLIGGKEVGKSALVNALVGQPISESTSFGPGTEEVIAYAHRDLVDAVAAVLKREAPSRHRIVTHSIDRLRRQVLLDLPDIDSVYSEHVELTRRMLRHMLFPVWVQSIEKYADQRPQKLLSAVAAGNDPRNFLFCLNKADQLEGFGVSGVGSRKDGSDPHPIPHTLNPIAELRGDFAARIGRTLSVPPPDVFVISAKQPDQFDLPALSKRLSQQKTDETVNQSITLAGKQRDRSMLSWIDQQQLPERVARLTRLEREADDLAASRLSVPLLDTVIPRLLDDPAHRAAMVDEVMNARVARWPIVNVLHTLLLPVTSIWRRNVGAAPTPGALVDAYASIQGRPIAPAVTTTFALLQQSHPSVGELYRHRRLWDESPAELAAYELRETLTDVLARQRAEATARIARGGIIAPLFRWLLTIGAVLWFPIVQPVLEVMLKDNWTQSMQSALLLTVQLLGAAYLLKSAAFLAIWFVFLWLVLRWDTQRKVSRLLSRWRTIEEKDRLLSAASAVLAWVDDLLEPIRTARQREESLARRSEQVREAAKRST